MGARPIRPPAAALVAAALVAGVAAAVLLVPAAPAAAVPGLTHAFEMTAYNSANQKTVTATCPAGTTVIGGGGYVYPATDQVFLTGLRPLVTLFGTGFQVLATEDDTGHGGNWRLSGYAICAPAPPGLQYRWTNSPTSSGSGRSATTTCPAGTRLLSTGALVSGGGSHVSLRLIYPRPGLTEMIAFGYEDEDGYAGSWTLTGYAVCADPPPGLERVVAGAQQWPISAVAACPWPKRILGAGGLVSTGSGQTRLIGMYPVPTVNSAYAVGSEDETGYPHPWAPTAIAICAD